MHTPYAGPLRDEPLGIELHNTIFAMGGRLVDGLGDAASADAFLLAIAPRLPHDQPPGPPPTAASLTSLRAAVRTAFGRMIDQTAHDAEALAAISAACRRAPTSPALTLGPGGEPELRTEHHGASRSDIVLAAFAASTIELIAGPQRANLGACGAPGCVLLFLRDHPRRQWCSNACGNRARQARHYRRVRGSRTPGRAP